VLPSKSSSLLLLLLLLIPKIGGGLEIKAGNLDGIIEIN